MTKIPENVVKSLILMSKITFKIIKMRLFGFGLFVKLPGSGVVKLKNHGIISLMLHNTHILSGFFKTKT